MPCSVMSEMIDINTYAYFMLHKYFLDRFLERSKSGKRSCLIGVASCTWLGFVRPFVHYAGTKASAGYLSTAINYELNHTGKRPDGSDTSLIDLQCSTPFGVGTNLVKTPYKEVTWLGFTAKVQTYCDGLEKDIG